MNTPKLQFVHAYPLDRGQRKLFEENGLAYPSMDEVKSTLTKLEQLWQEYELNKNIIAKLVEVTSKVPERNLECFVYGSGLGTMSTPFLLSIWNKEGKLHSDEKLIDLIIHELLHIFITTNNKAYWGFVEEKYAEEEALCRNHILLYAMLFKIYKDLFNQEPIDFSRNDLPSGYARSIEIVKEIGYEELIAEYKSFI